MTRRFIDVTPTWRTAAQIIAAALENGTDAGREAARAELSRMADMLDALKAEQQNGTALWEVITEASTGQPFGQTFGHQENAEAYAAAMRAAGYRAEVSPEFGTQPSFDAAMRSAAEFYGHPEILDALKLKEPQQ